MELCRCSCFMKNSQAEGQERQDPEAAVCQEMFQKATMTETQWTEMRLKGQWDQGHVGF